MTFSRASVVSGALVALLFAASLVSCGKLGPELVGGNLPPDTEITLARDAGDTTSVRVHVTWAGTDADGSVVYYWTRWDSLDWVRTTRTDSVYLLKVPDAADSSAVPPRHTLAVKAVDDRGAEDLTPAVVVVSGRNLLPETEIIDGPQGITCPHVHFEWRGWDYDGLVVGYGYRLYLWDGDLGDWLEVAGEDSLGPEEITIDFGPLEGTHRFDVWAIDDLDGVDPSPATGTFTSNPSLVGPTLYVFPNVLRNFTFRGPIWPAQYDEPIPIFEGEHLVFRWLADPWPCSSEIVGYSSAYDDTTEWGTSFSPDDTRFEVTPEPGVHALYVSAMDGNGEVTRGKICFEVVETTLDQHILLVDDYDWRELQPQWGTDDDRDAFYDTLAGSYVRPTVEWDAEDHPLEVPDASTLAGASTVIWYQDGESSALGDLFDPYNAPYDLLGGYVRVGGNLILCGFTSLGEILNEPYPLMVTASDTTFGEVFVRDALGISYADESGFAANKNAPWTYGYCFYGAEPAGTGIPGLATVDLEAMYIDSVGVGGFPEPGKWPLYTYTANPNYTRAGLPQVEKLNAHQGAPIESHVIDSYLNMEYEGETCMVLSPTGSDRGNVVYFGFPLYYLQTHQVKTVFDRLLPLLGEVPQ